MCTLSTGQMIGLILSASLAVTLVIAGNESDSELKRSVGLRRLAGDPGGTRVFGVHTIDEYSGEWIGEPTRSRTLGPERQVSRWQNVAEKGEIDAVFGLKSTFEYGGGVGLEVGKLLPGLDIKFSAKKGEEKETEVKHRLHCKPFSRAAIFFRENIINYQGHVRVKYVKKSAICAATTVLTARLLSVYCGREDRDESVNITVGELDATNNPMGEFYLRYEGTNEYKHPDFQSFADKNITHMDVEKFKNVTSPRNCGEQAIKRHKDIAVYKPATMECLVKSSKKNNGVKLHNKYGTFLGYYDVGTRKYDTETTRDKNKRDEWVQQEKCDTILDTGNGKFKCQKYPTLDGAVLMLRRYEKNPDETHIVGQKIADPLQFSQTFGNCSGILGGTCLSIRNVELTDGDTLTR